MPPYKKEKEDIKYKPNFGFSKAATKTMPVMAPPATLAPPAWKPVFPTMPPKKDMPANPCTHYMQPAFLQKLPFYYQRSQLETFYKDHPGILERLATTPEISKKIDHAYRRDAAKAKEEVLLEMIRPDDPDREPLMAFYRHVRIYTKAEFHQTLKKGFQWVRRGLKKRPWVMLTEKYNDTLDLLNRLPNAKEAPFKSTEWVGNLFLHHCAKYDAPLCQLGCMIDGANLAFVPPESVLDPYEVYLLFDDAAYSGQQKSLLLTTILKSIHVRRTTATVFVMIPYYTAMAIDRFRLGLRSYEQATGCSVSQTTRATEIVYEVKDPSQTRTVFIHLWTGGVLMEETATLMDALRMSPALKSRMVMDGLGATLTLFEHKVPDFLSLNAIFGQRFKSHPLMVPYYRENPPYKVVLLDGSRVA